LRGCNQNYTRSGYERRLHDDDQDYWLGEDEQARDEYAAQNNKDEKDGDFFIFGIVSGFFDWLFK